MIKECGRFFNLKILLLPSGGITSSLPAAEPNFFDEFVLIGRNLKHWQACNNALSGRNNDARTDELNPLMLK